MRASTNIIQLIANKVMRNTIKSFAEIVTKNSHKTASLVSHLSQYFWDLVNAIKPLCLGL